MNAGDRLTKHAIIGTQAGRQRAGQTCPEDLVLCHSCGWMLCSEYHRHIEDIVAARVDAARAERDALAATVERLQAELDEALRHRDILRAMLDAAAIAGLDPDAPAPEQPAYGYQPDTGVASSISTAERVGRCGDRSPSLLPSGATSFCRLPARHAGWHRGDDDSEWTPHGDALEQPDGGAA